MNEWREEMVAFEEIDLGATQCRDGLDPRHLQSITEALGDGDDLPPPQLVRLPSGRFLVVDGFHRLEALRRLGRAAARAEVADGTEADAAWLAAAANADQLGLPRDHAARRRAVEAALRVRPHLSNPAIAAHVGVSEATVRRVRAALAEALPPAGERVGKDGRAINTAGIGARADGDFVTDEVGGASAAAEAFAGSEGGETARRREAGRRAAANARAPLQDGEGADVPDHLRDAFADRALAEEADAIDALADAVRPDDRARRLAARAGVYRFLRPDIGAGLADAESGLRVAAAAARAAVPHAVCPACRGDAAADGEPCDGCRGCGHVPLWRLEELRGDAP